LSYAWLATLDHASRKCSHPKQRVCLVLLVHSKAKAASYEEMHSKAKVCTDTDFSAKLPGMQSSDAGWTGFNRIDQGD